MIETKSLEQGENVRPIEKPVAPLVDMADPQNTAALKAPEASTVGTVPVVSDDGFMNFSNIYPVAAPNSALTNLEASSIAPVETTAAPEAPVASSSAPAANGIAPFNSPTTGGFDVPYSDATIQQLQTKDPTLAAALSDAAPYGLNQEFAYAPWNPLMSDSGFSQFEQNVLASYNNYSPNGSLSNDANNKAILDSSLNGLTAGDSAVATQAINAATSLPYSDSTINQFDLSDAPVASALVAAEPNMSSQGFAQFEQNLSSNYAAALTPGSTETNADVLNQSTANLSDSDASAAQSAAQKALAGPYNDEVMRNFEDSPTLVQTLADAEPNMSVQGFTSFEKSLNNADSQAYSSMSTLNDAAVVNQSALGLSASDAAAATNAYAAALNYSGQAPGEAPPTLSAGPYSDTTTAMIGAFDSQLASIVSAAEPDMSSVGFGQFEDDANNLYNSGNVFNPNNAAIVTAAEQNLSASNQAALASAYEQVTGQALSG